MQAIDGTYMQVGGRSTPMQPYLTGGDARVSTSTPTPKRGFLARAGRVCCCIDCGMLSTMAGGLYLYLRLDMTPSRTQLALDCHIDVQQLPNLLDNLGPNHSLSARSCIFRAFWSPP